MSDNLASIRVTSEARSALRTAIKNASGWTSAFRNRHGFSFATMSRTDYFKAAELLGLDAEAIIKGANESPRAANPKAEKARAVFNEPAPMPVPAQDWNDPRDADNLEMLNRVDHAEAEKHKAMERVNKLADASGDARINKIAAMLGEMLATPQIDRNAVEEIIDAKLAEIKLPEAAPRVLEIKIADKPVVKLDGHKHPLFEDVLSLVAQGENVMLKGPAGCGKTYLASMVARAMNSRFGSISGSAGVSEAQLTGRLLPTGDGGKFEYTASQFVEIYENGGMFLFDEMDAFDPNCLLTINMATANGGFDIEARAASGLNAHVSRHEDTRLIAATNTFGTGADALYVGRAQLDAATLDRWYILEMDYDRVFEASLAPAKIVDFVWHLRNVINANRFRRVASTRAIQRAARGLAAGRKWHTVQRDLVTGWTPAEIAKINFAQYA